MSPLKKKATGRSSSRNSKAKVKMVKKTVTRSRSAARKSSLAKPQINQEQLNSMIAERAYYIWQEWGCPQGQDQQTWQQAESEIRARYSL